jgi:hypothetical protein
MRLILKPEQKPHAERLRKILLENFVAFDMSVMGAGKTYTATHVALHLKFKHVIIVCPLSVVPKWISMKKFGLPIYDVLSYESLRSIKGKDPKHGLLTRIDEGSKVSFEATDRLKTLAKENLFVIFDESQKIKNKNAQWFACKTIAETLLLSGGMSRFLLLSGTPIDKEEQALNIMKMLGFIRADKLTFFNKAYNTMTLYGIQELIDFCRFIDDSATQNVLKEQIITNENAAHVCYKLFQEVIKTSITSSMIPIKRSDVYIDLKNAEYSIEDTYDEINIRKAISEVNDSFQKFNEGRLDFSMSPGQNPELIEMKRKRQEIAQKRIQSIMFNLRIIENCKVRLMVKLARKKLEENKHNKVALFINYTSSLELLKNELSDYNPLLLDGSVSQENRKIVLDKFQEFNQKHRLIIGNVKVCSSGIDLDDKSPKGSFPRFVFASPNWSILDLQQLPSRFLRLDSKSPTMFRFIYAKNYRETGLLNNLSKKSKVMKETSKVQLATGIEFIGDLDMIDGDEELGFIDKDFE